MTYLGRRRIYGPLIHRFVAPSELIIPPITRALETGLRLLSSCVSFGSTGPLITAGRDVEPSSFVRDHRIIHIVDKIRTFHNAVQFTVLSFIYGHVYSCRGREGTTVLL